METSIYKRVGNSTTLTFCGQDVAPEMVTRLLNWVPSESYRVGDARNGRLSELGFWQLTLPNADPAEPVETQLVQWLNLLRGKSEALNTLLKRATVPIWIAKQRAAPYLYASILMFWRSSARYRSRSAFGYTSTRRTWEHKSG
jgi:hypothetical protein